MKRFLLAALGLFFCWPVHAQRFATAYDTLDLLLASDRSDPNVHAIVGATNVAGGLSWSEWRWFPGDASTVNSTNLASTNPNRPIGRWKRMTPDFSNLGTGTNASSDLHWTNSAPGQLRLVVNTNVLSVETHMSATNGTANSASIAGVTVIEDPVIMNAIGGAYAAIYEDTGIAVTNVTWSYGLAAENYIAATNSGPQFEDEVNGAYGIDGVVFGGGVFSVNVWTNLIPGAGYGVQGFGYSGYSFQAGVNGGAIAAQISGQTNLGVLGYVSFVKSGNTNVGVYGGTWESNTNLPAMVSAGGLFDAGPSTDPTPALIARKHDGTQSLVVASDAIVTASDLVQGKNFIPTVSTVTWAATNVLNFASSGIQTMALGGNWTGESTNLAAGRTITLVLTGAATNCTIALPASWIFIGGATPTSVSSNKTAVVTATSIGTTDAAVIASFASQL